MVSKYKPIRHSKDPRTRAGNGMVLTSPNALRALKAQREEQRLSLVSPEGYYLPENEPPSEEPSPHRGSPEKSAAFVAKRRAAALCAVCGLNRGSGWPIIWHLKKGESNEWKVQQGIDEGWSNQHWGMFLKKHVPVCTVCAKAWRAGVRLEKKDSKASWTKKEGYFWGKYRTEKNWFLKEGWKRKALEARKHAIEEKAKRQDEMLQWRRDEREAAKLRPSEDRQYEELTPEEVMAIPRKYPWEK